MGSNRNCAPWDSATGKPYRAAYCPPELKLNSPEVLALSSLVYSILSADSSLFRAGYIAKAVAQISERGGDEYLAGLRRMKYHEARKELIGLTGIGPKVDK